ncbi:MAG: hypothetical protein M5R40_19375 [Anaerolineae bacterium]|nr:hypothetical protein [Anaerolineae bacterium]
MGSYYNPVTWTLAFSDHEGGESAWAASGHRAVFAYAEGFDLVVWDVATGDKLAVLKGHTDAFWSSAWWSPDGTRLASAGTDDKVFIWDVVSGAQLAVFDCDWGFCERSLAWSPDGTRLAGVGSVDGRIMVRIWSTISGEQLTSLRCS